MTTRQAGVVDTESHRPCDGFNHWSYELDFTSASRGVVPPLRQQKMLFFCSMYQRNLFTPPASRRCRRELINGTNFRHAVECSRSGRTPSQSLRTGRGQPTVRYSVGSARSNLTQPRPLPTWSPHTDQPWRVALGGCSADSNLAPTGLPGDSVVAPCAEQGEH